jgi:hypothetical protein
MTLSLMGPVLLRSSGDFCRVIGFQNHSMFRQGAARVREQSKF